MQVKEIMTPHVVTVLPQANLEETARRMSQWDVGMLPVSDDGMRCLGVITDRDITVRAISEGKDPGKTKVLDVMSPNVVACEETQDVENAAQLMEQAQVRRLLVLNQNGLIAGVVTAGDLARRAGKEIGGEVLADTAAPDPAVPAPL